MRENELIIHMDEWRQTYANAFKSKEDFWVFFFKEMFKKIEEQKDLILINLELQPYDTMNIECLDICSDCGATGVHGCTGPRKISKIEQDCISINSFPKNLFKDINEQI